MTVAAKSGLRSPTYPYNKLTTNEGADPFGSRPSPMLVSVNSCSSMSASQDVSRENSNAYLGIISFSHRNNRNQDRLWCDAIKHVAEM